LTAVSISIMSTRRVTANLPVDLLDAAIEVTGKGITETIVEGLTQVRQQRFYERAIALRGKIRLEIDPEQARGRRRH
jgi:hypothetical protein